MTEIQTLFCRLTIDKSIEEVQTILLKKYNSFIVSQEDASNRHFHILIYHEETNKKNARQNLRNFLKKEFEIIGNSDYAITETKTGTQDTLTKYVIKDGNFVSSGVDEKKLQILQKQSYKKFKKDEFKIGLQKIRDDYIADPEQGLQEHIAKLLRYKCVQYNQDCNMNLIKNYAITSYMKKNDIHHVNRIAEEMYGQIFRE